MNYLEGNKLIAEFLGYPKYKIEFEGKRLNFENSSHNKYHTDWNRLMFAVHKIESLGVQTFKDLGITVFSRFEIKHNHIQLRWSSNHNYQFAIDVVPEFMHPEYCGISKTYKCIKINKNSTQIHALWIAVVEFVKWYNDDKSNSNRT